MIPDGFLQEVDGQQPPLVSNIDLQELGIKPALAVPRVEAMPPYVSRDCDSDLKNALKKGGLVIVEGPVRSGRTRTAFQGVHTAFPQRSILVPQSRGALEKLSHTGPVADSVIWLDDVERFFDESDLTLARGLCPPNRPDVVVVATAKSGTSFSSALSRWATNAFSVTRNLSKTERRSAERLQSDPRISAALLSGMFGDVRLAEDLAAGPLLRDRWSGDTDDLLSATGTAIVSAAIDVYLAGYRDGVPAAVLENLYRPFLPESLRYNPGLPAFSEALKWACSPVHGFSSLLVALRDNRYRASYQLACGLSDQSDRPVVRDETWESVIEFSGTRSCRSVGLRAFAAGRHDLAERALQRAVNESDPDDDWVAAVNNELGVVLAAQGRQDEAQRAFLKSAKGGFDTGMANLARSLAERGDARSSEEWNRKAAHMGDTQAIDQLVEQLGTRGDYEEAAYWCRIALRAGDGAPLSRLASFYDKAGDRESAELLLREGIDHEDPLAMVNLGRVLEDRGEFEEAKKLYQKAAKLGFGPGYTALGMLAEERDGDLDEAQGYYRQGIAAGDIPAARQLGILLLTLNRGGDYETQGNLVEVYELLERAAERDDDLAVIVLAAVLDMFGMPHRAREWLRSAAEKGRVPAMILLAEQYKRQGEHKQAEQWMARALALGDAKGIAKVRSMLSVWADVAATEDEPLPTRESDNWLTLARGLIDHRGEVARSEQECRRAVNGGDTAALMDLAILLILRHEIEDAWALIRRASELDDPDGLAAHGFLLMIGGDDATAEILINRVSDSDHPIVATMKFVMSNRKGDYTAAKQWIAKVSRPMAATTRPNSKSDSLLASMSKRLRLVPGLTPTNVELAAVWFLDSLYSYREAEPDIIPRPEDCLQIADEDHRPLVGEVLDQVVKLLAKNNLINIDPARDGLVLTSQGRRTVVDRQDQRRDLVARRGTCRQALLLWVYAAEVTGDHDLGLASIHETPLGYCHGKPFTAKELQDSITYLHQQSLIATRDECSILTITADGSDCVEQYQAFIADFIKSRNMIGQSINIGGDNYGNAAAVGTGDAAQNQNHTEGIDTEELLKALNGIRAVIPHLDLEPSDATDLETAIDQVGHEGDTLTPTRSRSLLERIKAILARSTSVLASGLLSTVENLVAGLSG